MTKGLAVLMMATLSAGHAAASATTMLRALDHVCGPLVLEDVAIETTLGAPSSDEAAARLGRFVPPGGKAWPLNEAGVAVVDFADDRTRNCLVVAFDVTDEDFSAATAVWYDRRKATDRELSGDAGPSSRDFNFFAPAQDGVFIYTHLGWADVDRSLAIAEMSRSRFSNRARRSLEVRY
ncbi:MAG: hypothetical protein AAF192_23695 [Pseudomonadota bacterium]